MMVESESTADATRRLNVKKQTLDDAYAVPANFLEIDVKNPKTTELAGKKRYTEYEVNMRVCGRRGTQEDVPKYVHHILILPFPLSSRRICQCSR